MFKEFASSSINFKVTFWVKYQSNGTDYVPALNKAIIGIKKAFDENDIMIPFPIRTLDFGTKESMNMSQMFNSTKSETKSDK